MMPIGLILLFLTGIGPLLAWRKSTVDNFKTQFLWPTLSAVVTAGALAALGVRVWSSGLCFALCAFVTGTIVQEFVRGGNVRRRTTGTDLLTAIVGLVGRNKRRYGGYIVHLGIVLIFLGFAGNGFKRDTQVSLKPGEEATIGHYTVRNDGLKVSDDGQKQMVTGYISVFQNGKQIDTLYPARWYFRKHENEADDGGRDSPDGRRGSLPRARRGLAEHQDAVGEPGDSPQSARELDLVRLRRDGARHRHRAAAGARVLVRARQRARC